ncbi:MAG: MBL fold metallo-hydrolase [Opitutae bacterium]|nr:MBL fold metallo-hydrolase [Opitutae bacterium]
MEVIILGSGTSQGVPLIACDCPVCTSGDPRNRRTRASIHVVMDGLRIQVDATPEFRLQCVRERIAWIDLFLLTHEHADHITGMDDLRRFCDLLGGSALPVYSTPAGLARVQAIYPYAICERPATKGYAAFRLQPMPSVLELPQGTIHSTLLPHGDAQTLGLVFVERSSGKKFVYYTDCKQVPPAAIALARGADALVLDGLRPKPHPSHLSIDEAVAVAREIGAPRTWLTHLTHLTDHAELAAGLPAGIAPAHDGLRVVLSA